MNYILKHKIKHILLAVIGVFVYCLSTAQGNFDFTNNLNKQSISFKLLNNLIVFPIEVNGEKLNFILDSGVGGTVLFNLNARDSIKLNNVKRVKLQGLGGEEPINAAVSRGNTFTINSIENTNELVYVIDNDSFDLSSKLGITVNGIIGYSLLKNLEVKINYSTKKITFYKKGTFDYSKCRKCESFNLEFYQLKPYMNIEAKLSSATQKATPIKVLVDSGGSDAMWLFTNSHPDIKGPEKYFHDFLGEGLSGSIYGKKSKIKSLVIGSFEMHNPTVSYPDSLSIVNALKYAERNGSLGGSILRRFTVIFDYNSAKITLKKGGNFNKPFRYNMSGIELVHNGKILVKERDKNKSSFSFESSANSPNGNRVHIDYNYKFTFKPSYKIFKLVPNSPADNAGLMVGDVVIKINGKYTFEMDLDEIIGTYFQKENKRINMVVERYGQDYDFNFTLKDILK